MESIIERLIEHRYLGWIYQVMIQLLMMLHKEILSFEMLNPQVKYLNQQKDCKEVTSFNNNVFERKAKSMSIDIHVFHKL